MSSAIENAPQTDSLRSQIRQHYLADEAQCIKQLIARAALSEQIRQQISENAAALVRQVRSNSSPTMMEKFLGEYGLNTEEGVALMCLAEALLRVPDSYTIDALIEDKICSGNWSEHRGQSNSSLINSSTWALLITGKLIGPIDSQGLTQTLRSLLKRLGEPVVRTAVAQAMKELGRQFVLGRTISEATSRARKYEKQGYSYSYDMLGEAARTDADALRYHQAYSDAIAELATSCQSDDIRTNPGISVKLSALHPRYEYGQREQVLEVLVERTKQLARQARAANMGFNIDAEEADRLDLSLDIIEAVLSDPELEGWDGFGVVVQAFGQRAPFVLDWLYALAQRLDRKIMIRLVKGAYWDAEIKRAQTLGLDGFPVFTRKHNSDLSYIACAKQLLQMTDRIYPQFATHNAHSVSAILSLADDKACFEFQRLHGMGESLHDTVLKQQGTRCRIYAPVGAHSDLLAYLVRRLLENGANSSFVNQIVDTRISPEQIASDPFDAVLALGDNLSSQAIARPADIFGKGRINARGWDITDPMAMDELDRQRNEFRQHRWSAGPITATGADGAQTEIVRNPANPEDHVGQVTQSSRTDIDNALRDAVEGAAQWQQVPAEQRAACLKKVADLYEQHAPELFALTCREAGKSMLDSVAEIREAVDFARFYADEGVRNAQGQARGVICCISPWNFPLAIFSGQILAALAAGNSVVAKPAPQTVLIAARAVELMHQAGIPRDALQLLPGDGAEVGGAMTSDPRVDGVCFTGSTATAQLINRSMADKLSPSAPLIAETGGLNAMIVDSTALPEQVVRDVLASAFQSAGQRCSALRMLYIQEDIADSLLEMLFGAMDELKLDNPWLLSTDIGPVIDQASKDKIDNHCAAFAAQGRLIKQLPIPAQGTFVAPAVIRLDSIDQLEQEIFGPILHVATYKANELDQVIDKINARGYGLTFGLHTRVDNRVDHIISRIKVGNLYVNRNQIGAVVGSQPFGGEGLSGTGPKAGGPHYVARFRLEQRDPINVAGEAKAIDSNALEQALAQIGQRQVEWSQQADKQAKLKALFGDRVDELNTDAFDAELMPGPTGELNRLSSSARGTLLCLGPDSDSARDQAILALAQGNAAVVVTPNTEALTGQAAELGLPLVAIDGQLQAEALGSIQGIAAICSYAEDQQLKAYRQVLAQRDGELLALITERNAPERLVLERHLCIDTTAAGGNASLIAASE
ncbi:bifunctional proline dehydrogenase/L-glutamate gamma-semialdehyde dehydrogenase PutA [Motiliproteus sp.]|uniref:bifunctional proline dehydrogenase/L-glutamate gamma-semialdehyde dehydrogenase PutA n=1 Tax=Motiliproteus sp. TaxID=1898955 RepID=UPI003BAB0CFD